MPSPAKVATNARTVARFTCAVWWLGVVAVSTASAGIPRIDLSDDALIVNVEPGNLPSITYLVSTADLSAAASPRIDFYFGPNAGPGVNLPFGSIPIPAEERGIGAHTLSVNMAALLGSAYPQDGDLFVAVFVPGQLVDGASDLQDTDVANVTLHLEPPAPGDPSHPHFISQDGTGLHFRYTIRSPGTVDRLNFIITRAGADLPAIEHDLPSPPNAPANTGTLVLGAGQLNGLVQDGNSLSIRAVNPASQFDASSVLSVGPQSAVVRVQLDAFRFDVVSDNTAARNAEVDLTILAPAQVPADWILLDLQRVRNSNAVQMNMPSRALGHGLSGLLNPGSYPARSINESDFLDAVNRDGLTVRAANGDSLRLKVRLGLGVGSTLDAQQPTSVRFDALDFDFSSAPGTPATFVYSIQSVGLIDAVDVDLVVDTIVRQDGGTAMARIDQTGGLRPGASQVLTIPSVQFRDEILNDDSDVPPAQRIANLDPVTARASFGAIPPPSGDHEPDSFPADVRITVSDFQFDNSDNARFDLDIVAPAKIRPFATNLARGTPAGTLVSVNPVVPVDPGFHNDIDIPDFRGQLNTLSNGQRIKNGDDLFAVPTSGSAVTDFGADSSRAASVQVEVNRFYFDNENESNPNDRDEEFDIRILAPAKINAFTTEIHRGSYTPGATPLVNVLTSIDADPNSVLLEPTDVNDPGSVRTIAITNFRDALNEVINGQRVSHNDVLLAAPNLAASNTNPIVNASHTASVSVSVSAFDFDNVDGSFANVSYVIDAPARINEFGIEIFRSTGDPAWQESDENLNHEVPPEPSDPSAPIVARLAASDSSFDAGSHSNVDIPRYRSLILDRLPNGQRLSHNDLLFALPVGLDGNVADFERPSTLAEAAGKRAAVDLSFVCSLCGASVTNSTPSTISVQARYRVFAPARVNDFGTLFQLNDGTQLGIPFTSADTSQTQPGGERTVTLTFGTGVLIGHSDRRASAFLDPITIDGDPVRVDESDDSIATDPVSNNNYRIFNLNAALASLSATAAAGNEPGDAILSQDETLRIRYEIVSASANEFVVDFRLFTPANASEIANPTCSSVTPSGWAVGQPIAERFVNSLADLQQGIHELSPRQDLSLPLSEGAFRLENEDVIALKLLRSQTPIDPCEPPDNDDTQPVSLRARVNMRPTGAGQPDALQIIRVTDGILEEVAATYDVDSPGRVKPFKIRLYQVRDGQRTAISETAIAGSDLRPGLHTVRLNTSLLSRSITTLPLIQSDKLEFELDPDHEVRESSESDNVSAQTSLTVNIVANSLVVTTPPTTGTIDDQVRDRSNRALASVGYEIAPGLEALHVAPFVIRIHWDNLNSNPADDPVLWSRTVDGTADLIPGLHEIREIALGEALATYAGQYAPGLSPTLYVVVDAANAIAESSESDNRVDATIQYLSDVRLNPLSFVEPASGASLPAVRPGQRFDVQISVDVLQNDFNRDIDFLLEALVRKDSASQEFVSAAGFVPIRGTIPLLGIDDYVNIRRIAVTAPAESQTPGGDFKIRVTLDPDRKIAEYDEANNMQERFSNFGADTADQDKDGISDADEARGFTISRYSQVSVEGAAQIRPNLYRTTVIVKTDPLRFDTDGDGIDDLSEITTYALGWGRDRVLPGVTVVGRAGFLVVSGLRDQRAVPILKPVWGVRTDPTSKDTDGDGIDDNYNDGRTSDLAPQFNPAVLNLGLSAAEQALLLDFDQDQDGFLEAPDANLDGVPDFTRWTEKTLERVFSLDFSNDGTLDDGFDVGGIMEPLFVDALGLTDAERARLAPVDDPATRTFAGTLASDEARAAIDPRFGTYRVGSFGEFAGGEPKYRSTASASRFAVVGDTPATTPGIPGFVDEFSLSLPTVDPWLLLPASGAGGDAGRPAAPFESVTRRGDGRIDDQESVELEVDGAAKSIAFQSFPVDNCPGSASDEGTETIRFNPTQADIDNDGIGDSCDPDVDNDGVSNAFENVVGGCGAGLCGAGAVQFVPLTMLGIALLSRPHRRRRF